MFLRKSDGIRKACLQLGRVLGSGSVKMCLDEVKGGGLREEMIDVSGQSKNVRMIGLSLRLWYNSEPSLDLRV